MGCARRSPSREADARLAFCRRSPTTPDQTWMRGHGRRQVSPQSVHVVENRPAVVFVFADKAQSRYSSSPYPPLPEPAADKPFDLGP